MAERVIYGLNTVLHALETQRSMVLKVYMKRDLGQQRLRRLADQLRQESLTVDQVSDDELLTLTGTRKHQGVAAVISGLGQLNEAGALDYLAGLTAPLVLLLDGIEDPRNYGACLRTADGAGVDLVVSGRSRGVDITPVVSKVASGAAESVPIVRVANLARFMSTISDLQFNIIGLDEAGGSSLFEVDLTGPTALVLGAEGAGLRRLTREHCHRLVRLPMAGSVSSLNVSVAAGICLYEAVRQRAA